MTSVILGERTTHVPMDSARFTAVNTANHTYSDSTPRAPFTFRADTSAPSRADTVMSDPPSPKTSRVHDPESHAEEPRGVKRQRSPDSPNVEARTVTSAQEIAREAVREAAMQGQEVVVVSPGSASNGSVADEMDDYSEDEPTSSLNATPHGQHATSPTTNGTGHYPERADSLQQAEPGYRLGPDGRLYKKRAFAHRTKTGCHTCRRRKKKCDEGKPTCNNCHKGSFRCDGYGDKKIVPPQLISNSRGRTSVLEPRPRNHPVRTPAMPIRGWPAGNGPPPPERFLPHSKRSPPSPIAGPPGHAHGGTAIPGHVPGPALGPGPSPGPSPVPGPRHAPGHASGPGPSPVRASGHAPDPSYPRPYPIHDRGPYRGPLEMPSEQTRLSDTSSTGQFRPAAALSPISNSGPRPSPYEGDRLLERRKMVNGQPHLHYADNVLVQDRQDCKNALYRYHEAVKPYSMHEGDPTNLLRAVFHPASRRDAKSEPHPPHISGSIGQRSKIETPFSCDYGYNTHIGDDVIIQSNCRIEDPCKVEIGSRTMICANVTICGASFNHDLGSFGHGAVAVGRPIVIEEGCRIGANSVITGGVTIGAGTIVEPGSVVTHDIMRGMHVGGNPADFIRSLRPEGSRPEPHFRQPSDHARPAQTPNGDYPVPVYRE